MKAGGTYKIIKRVQRQGLDTSHFSYKYHIKSTQKYTETALREAVKNSTCFSDVLRYLNLPLYASMYDYIKCRLSIYKISCTHFTRKSSGGRKVNCRKKLPREILVKKERTSMPTSGVILRRVLLEMGVKYECCWCAISSWKDKPIRLQVDHIDGDKWNNCKENLRFLCPNCHSQTDNFGAKNRYKYVAAPERTQAPRRNTVPKKEKQCIRCSKPCRNKYCSYACACISSRKVERPSKAGLEVLIKTKPILAIAKHFGVRDAAIRLWAERYGLSWQALSPFIHKNRANVKRASLLKTKVAEPICTSVA